MENLRALAKRKENFVVTLRFNFDQQNHTMCGDFLDMVKREFGGDPRFRPRFRPVGKWGGPNDSQLAVCGSEDVAHLERGMKLEARKRGLTLSDDISTLGGLGTQVCYAARPYNFVIGATGKLMKCTLDLDKNDRNVVGQISENGELVLDEDKLAMWTEPAFESDGKCKKCVVLPACQGIYCPLVRIDRNETPCSPVRKTGKRELAEAVRLSEPRKKRIATGEAARPASAPLPELSQ